MPRFHLSFDYQNARGARSHGDQVIIADAIEDAVRQIARERGVREVHVRKRHFYGKPASASETIDRTFTIAPSTCSRCGSVLSVVTWTCVRGEHCKPGVP